jgi:hypothetical protein
MKAPIEFEQNTWNKVKDYCKKQSLTPDEFVNLLVRRELKLK